MQNIILHLILYILEPALIHRILLNQPLRAIVILLLVAAPIPLFVYMIGFSREILNGGRPNAVINGSCAHFDSFHVPCGPPVSILYIVFKNVKF